MLHRVTVIVDVDVPTDRYDFDTYTYSEMCESTDQGTVAIAMALDYLQRDESCTASYYCTVLDVTSVVLTD